MTLPRSPLAAGIPSTGVDHTYTSLNASTTIQAYAAAPLDITASNTIHFDDAGKNVLVLSSLDIAGTLASPTATLDLKDRDLIIQSTNDTDALAALTNINAWLKSGYDAGAWDGTGTGFYTPPSDTSWQIDWGDGTVDTTTGSAPTPSHSYTTGDGVYSVNVIGTLDDGSQIFSDEMPINVAPAPVTGLTATDESGGTVELSWTPNSLLATGYNIEVSEDGGAYTLYAADVPASLSSFDIQNLAADSYSYRVYAISQGGTSTATTATATAAGGTASTPLISYDDNESDAVDLGFTINFYGVQTRQVYVSNNGNITFNGYDPSDATDGYSPVTPFSALTFARIAPFFADVDTSESGGTVTYGSTTYSGHQAFTASWSGVDYFNAGNGTHQTLSDTFTVNIVNRADTGPGNFDIVFVYGALAWDTGDASGGADGLVDPTATVSYPARAGYTNGTGVAGTYFEVAGSGTAGGLLGEAGQTIVMQVRIANPTLRAFVDIDPPISAPDNPSVPSKIIPLLVGSSGYSSVDLDLHDSTTITGTYQYQVLNGSGGIVSAGYFDSGYLAHVQLSPGLFTVKVTSVTVPGYERNLRFYSAKLTIQWTGGTFDQNSASRTLLHYNDDITLQTVTAYAGQQINIGYSFDAPAGTYTAATVPSIWTLGPSLWNYVSGYAPTANASGDHSPPSAESRESSLITFYAVTDARNDRIDILYRIVIGGQQIEFKNSIFLDIQKPGQGIWNTGTNFSFHAIQDSPVIDTLAGKLTDHITWGDATPAAGIGQVSYVQLISTYRYYENALGTPITIKQTFGKYILDTTYPYVVGDVGDDNPWESLGSLRGIVYMNDSFKLWMMWTPPGAGSIAVPIQFLNWAWRGHVYRDTDLTWKWFDRAPFPVPDTGLRINGAATNNFPDPWTEHY